MKTFDEMSINNILENIKNGDKITRNNKIFFQNMYKIRKANILYAHNNTELIEYSKCYNNIFYFIEKYCIDNDNNLRLYDFQKKILNEFSENKFIINMISPQMNFTKIIAIYFLHKLLFNNNYNILLLSYKNMNSVEIINYIKEYYKELPFFLKKGVKLFNNTSIVFEDNSKIVLEKSNISAISNTFDLIFLNEFSKFDNQEIFYKNLIPSLSSNSKSQLIINSKPNGFNFFTDLVNKTEENHPERNLFKLIKTYWWEIKSRNENWKNEQIKIIGSNNFYEEYEFKFIIK